MRPLFLILFLTAFTVSCNQNKETRKWVVQAPAGSEYLKVNKQGKTILPNGRFIEPYGKTYTTAPHPFGLIMSPDGHIAVTANSGTSPLSVTILKNIFSQNPEIRQVPEGAYTDKGILASVFMGLAISPDNQILYVAGGQESVVYLFDINNGEKLGEIDCSEDHSHGYIGDMKLSKDGQRLYAVDQINFSLLVIDTQQHKVIERIPTGRYPFGLELSPDGKKAWVANVGMYEYSILPGMDRENLDSTAWDFPAYAYLSKESIDGMVKDSIEIPGLGDPNVPESFSVWGVDLKTNKVISKIKTGFLVGEEIEGIPAVGGASPNSVVATNQYVFVSNGNNDCVSVIDVAADSVVKNIFLSPDERLKTFRGVIPFGLCLSPDKKRLYVAESGINAIGVINVEALDVIGHIPAGWFPSKIGMSNDGQKLVVANAKGFGSGPNGGS
ncbi:MAG: hypothetical protein OEX02_11505, partial [Cyclobacteriaceae bacterium]|nr:hypothetical protein [Cyclobacteriaceae bacterium]